MKIVHVVNMAKAKNLMLHGFVGNEEWVGERMVYSFVESPELMKFIKDSFTAWDFYITDTMNF